MLAARGKGADGAKLFAAPSHREPRWKCRWLRTPITMDTPSIVVASDDIFGPNNCQTPVSRQELGQNRPGVTYGSKVYTDAMNRWVPTRSIWNQHSYHITNVNDDGKIPTIRKPNWQTYNNFPPKKYWAPPVQTDRSQLATPPAQRCRRSAK